MRKMSNIKNMKKMKKRILCAAALLSLMPAAAFAADDALLVAAKPVDIGNSGDAVAAVEPAGAVASLSAYGEVEEVGRDYVVLKLDKGAAVGRVQLNVTDESAIVDNASGEFGKLSDIRVGERVYAYFSERMTRSVPAQSAMALLLTNVEESTPGLLWTVEDVAHYDSGFNGGGTRLTVNHGDLVLTVNDTDESEKILPGATVVAWYDVVMPSLPAQAVADRVRVLIAVDHSEAVEEAVQDAVQDADTTENIKSLTVNGKKLDMAVEYVNGVAMVPLRAVAERLGFVVNWQSEDMSVNLNNGTVQTRVYNGVDSYYYATALEGMVGMSKPEPLGAAMYFRGGWTAYAPAALFELLGASVAVDDGVLSINIQ